MKQSRKMSLMEALLKTGISGISALGLQLLIFPLYGITIDMHQNVSIVLIFTAHSLIINYGIRRGFNSIKG